MNKRYKPGDVVWFVSKMGSYRKRREGIVDDVAGDLMTIFLEFHANPVGGCKECIGAQRVDGRWRVYRTFQGYLEPLRRVSR